MLNKLSIRWRLTILSAILLTVCLIGLTIILNFSAFNMANQIDASVTTPAIQIRPSQNSDNIDDSIMSAMPLENIQEAKRVFSIQSIIYMLIVIIGGGTLTYYISGKALKPLDILNGQVKNLNVHNLAEALDIPPVKDEIAELTQSFNEMTDKLNDAFMTQKRFSASAAHELRTPLAVLQTKVDVFKKKRLHTSDEYEALITVFEKQIIRLRGLVGSLLDMTNMEDDGELSFISLKDIFDDILLELLVVAKNKDVSLLIDCDDSSVYGNVDLLYRAFYNLIENGIKYNVTGGYVKVKATDLSDKEVEILVIDSGIGIPDTMKQQIFEPFYRVDKSRSREMGGAGLGLSIVKSAINKSNGSITVTNNKDVGTCFTVILNSK